MTLIQRLRHLFLQFLSGDYCLLQLLGANTQPSACAIPEKLGMFDSDSCAVLDCCVVSFWMFSCSVGRG